MFVFWQPHIVWNFESHDYVLCESQIMRKFENPGDVFWQPQILRNIKDSGLLDLAGLLAILLAGWSWVDFNL